MGGAFIQNVTESVLTTFCLKVINILAPWHELLLPFQSCWVWRKNWFCIVSMTLMLVGERKWITLPFLYTVNLSAFNTIYS